MDCRLRQLSLLSTSVRLYRPVHVASFQHDDWVSSVGCLVSELESRRLERRQSSAFTRPGAHPFRKFRWVASYLEHILPSDRHEPLNERWRPFIIRQDMQIRDRGPSGFRRIRSVYTAMEVQ